MTLLRTYGELFSGGGGWGEGAKSLGLRPLWAIEKDKKIAAVWRWNNKGATIVNKPIETLQPSDYISVDVLFASPPCQAFSNARTELRAHGSGHLGAFVYEWIQCHRPAVFFIENVPQYRHTRVFQRLIMDLHDDFGYQVHILDVDAVDYGVPQTRCRTVAIGTRQPSFPPIPTVYRYTGWYDTIADILPRMQEDELAPSICEWLGSSDPRLIWATLERDYHQRAHKLRGGKWHREPARPLRAFAISGAHASRGPSVRADYHPMFTVVASIAKQPLRIITGPPDYRIYRLNNRALARFQTFPDSYVLPKTNTLAGIVLGNAVPPKLARALLEPFVYEAKTAHQLP